MEYKKACKIGSDGWALRLSNDCIIVSSKISSRIHTGVEDLELKYYKSENFNDWMPFIKFPEYIPKSQLFDWIKEKYKKFRIEELNSKIEKLKKSIE